MHFVFEDTKDPFVLFSVSPTTGDGEGSSSSSTRESQRILKGAMECVFQARERNHLGFPDLFLRDSVSLILTGDSRLVCKLKDMYYLSTDESEQSKCCEFSSSLRCRFFHFTSFYSESFKMSSDDPPSRIKSLHLSTNSSSNPPQTSPTSSHSSTLPGSRPTLAYILIRWLFRFVLGVFYSNVVVEGEEHITRDGMPT